MRIAQATGPWIRENCQFRHWGHIETQCKSTRNSFSQVCTHHGSLLLCWENTELHRSPVLLLQDLVLMRCLSLLRSIKTWPLLQILGFMSRPANWLIVVFSTPNEEHTLYRHKQNSSVFSFLSRDDKFSIIILSHPLKYGILSDDN